MHSFLELEKSFQICVILDPFKAYFGPGKLSSIFFPENPAPSLFKLEDTLTSCKK